MPIVSLSNTYVYLFHAEDKPIEYNVRTPQILKCAWEEIVVFPTLDSATNPQFEGIRLMDVAERVASDDLGQNLRASGFGNYWRLRLYYRSTTTLSLKGMPFSI
jgi:hypothetical protein